MQNQRIGANHFDGPAAVIDRIAVIKLNRSKIAEKKDIRRYVPHLKGIRHRRFLQRDALRTDTHG